MYNRGILTEYTAMSFFGKIGFALLGLLITTSIGLAAPSTNPKRTNGGEGPLCTRSTTTTCCGPGVSMDLSVPVQICSGSWAAFGVIALIAFVYCRV